MTIIILHTRNLTDNKMSVTHLVFMFQLIFFRILRSWKHGIPILPIRSARYVLKSFGYFEVSNRLRNWNKVKNFNYVVSKLQLCQLEIPIFIHKLMCHCSLINTVSFVICEFNGVACWNEGKSIISVRSSMQIPK